MKKYARLSLLAALFGSLALTACNSSQGSTGAAAPNGGVAPGIVSPSSPAGTPAAPSARAAYSTDVLLFTGSGTWGTEISALQGIMDQNAITYKSVGSSELDAMTVDDLAKFGMILIPGGAGGTEAGSVSSQTHANLREAVQQRGVSYLGFCAGAFVAVAPTPAAGQDVSYGFGVLNGAVLDYPPELANTTYTITKAGFADGTSRDILWYGGPVTPTVQGGVVAKYPAGEPMITEAWSGKGFVMLSAVHPAVSGSVVGLASTSDSDIALKLIQSALNQRPLPAF